MGFFMKKSFLYHDFIADQNEIFYLNWKEMSIFDVNLALPDVDDTTWISRVADDCYMTTNGL